MIVLADGGTVGRSGDADRRCGDVRRRHGEVDGLAGAGLFDVVGVGHDDLDRVLAAGDALEDIGAVEVEIHLGRAAVQAQMGVLAIAGDDVAALVVRDGDSRWTR